MERNQSLEDPKINKAKPNYCTVSLSLEAGYQPNHVQPGVPHGGVQDAPRRLHHAFLRERELAMNKLSDPIHVSE